MKKTFFSIVIFQLVFFVFLVSSYSQNILTITTANLDEDYIKIIETNNHTKPKFNKINMYIENGVIVISKKQHLFYGISLIGIIGFLAAAIMGVWLLVAILKKGRL